MPSLEGIADMSGEVMSDETQDVSHNIENLELKLSRCRIHINSKLENQRNSALVLSAVEENIENQGNKRSPVAYFISFLALLDQAVVQDEVREEKLAGAAAYFLDITLPFLPKLLLRQKFSEILTKLAPILTNQNVEALLVKSSIGSLEGLLQAQDSQQWLNTSNVSPKRALLGILELSFDPRPKVRKRAQDAIRNVLASPPASPSPVHPGAALCAEIARKKVESLLQSKSANKNASKNKEFNTTMIHTLQLITSITLANSWPTNQVESLCDVLLMASKTPDEYVVAAAFNAFHGLFASMSNDIDVEKFASILNIIVDLKPSPSDTHLSVAWLAVIANAYLAFAKLLVSLVLEKMPQILQLVSEFISSESKDIYSSASQSFIAIVCEAIPDSCILQTNSTTDNAVGEQLEDVISFVAKFIEEELFSIKYQHAISALIEIVIACVNKFRSRANPDFLNVLEIVGNWRSNEEYNFPHNKVAEELVASCIVNMGPEVVLSTLPLNLTGSSGKVGRAWLLPILRDHVRLASLQFYQKNILPIADHFRLLISESQNQQSMQCKVFETIIDQIWSLLPAFCELATDLENAFTDEFAAFLADTLYKEVSMRVVICKSLKNVVESNVMYVDASSEDNLFDLEKLTKEASVKNLEILASKAPNMLSVLFNVFSSTLPESRGYILDTIDAYLGIVSPEDLEVSFNKVCSLLKQALDDEKDSQSSKPKDNSPVLSSTMMDLVVAMAKYVPETSFNALFAILANAIFMQENALIQKRSYRIITKLSETESGKSAIEQFNKDIQKVMIDTSDCTNTSCRAARLAAMQEIVSSLPISDLGFIPSILQEVIMSTKDVNEKSREISYSLLIQMGKKMQAGGFIVPANGDESVEANLQEYLTMVCAGLAAQSPHMISAAITAISCILYEFKDVIPQETIMEIVSTVELFLTHNSREIAKAAIGFVKVEILALSPEFIKSNLPELLTKLMKWSHVHKSHFKSKVKHIIERLIRKFGVELVEQAIPVEDRKLVANIKKSRSRAKRKDEEAVQAGNSSTTEKRFVSAFEEAVYDSDSDAEDSYPVSKEGYNKQPEKFILTSGDDPLDLLDRQALAHISSSKPKKFGKKDVKGHEFATKNGKFVFNESQDSTASNATESGIDAYLDAVKQAPVRGQKNKLKFKKSKEDDWSDSEEPTNSVKAEREPKASRISKSRITKPKQKFKARKKL